MRSTYNYAFLWNMNSILRINDVYLVLYCLISQSDSISLKHKIYNSRYIQVQIKDFNDSILKNEKKKSYFIISCYENI